MEIVLLIKKTATIIGDNMISKATRQVNKKIAGELTGELMSVKWYRRPILCFQLCDMFSLPPLSMKAANQQPIEL